MGAPPTNSPAAGLKGLFVRINCTSVSLGRAGAMLAVPEWKISMARVLIIGASKGIGLETTRQALEGGHQVRALARSAAGIGLSDPKLDKVRGDALVSKDIEAALNGIEVVIVAKAVPGAVRAQGEAANVSALRGRADRAWRSQECSADGGVATINLSRSCSSADLYRP